MNAVIKSYRDQKKEQSTGAASAKGSEPLRVPGSQTLPSSMHLFEEA